MSKVLCLAALMVVLVVSLPAQAQDDNPIPVPNCVVELTSCGPFINSTTARPPIACCQPLERVIENDAPCLCSVFSNLELIQALSINVTEALTLPQRCGLHLHLDVITQCEALGPSVAPSMSPSATAPSPTSGMD